MRGWSSQPSQSLFRYNIFSASAELFLPIFLFVPNSPLLAGFFVFAIHLNFLFILFMFYSIFSSYLFKKEGTFMQILTQPPEISLDFTPFDWLVAHVTDQVKHVIKHEYPNTHHRYYLIQDIYQVVIQVDSLPTFDQTLTSAKIIAIDHKPTKIPLFIK